MTTNQAICRILLSTISIASLGLTPKLAAAGTPDFWNCASMISGSWNYGDAPNACTVNFQQTPADVRSEFSPAIFQDKNAGSSERSRYLSNMYPIMRDFAAYYIRRRNPSVSAAEVAGFQQALFALLAQESFWTHYRVGTDGLMRYMRGDSGHGHGIMQLDDNAHYTILAKSASADLAENVMFGLDEFYANWVSSKTASCISSPSDYVNRARSAWAAYNGGAGSICRWAQSDSPWASHDIAFHQVQTAKTWLQYVASTSVAAMLNVKCLAEGVRPCAVGVKHTVSGSMTDGLYDTSDGRSCLLKGTSLECLDNFQDVTCLEIREGAGLLSQGTMTSEQQAKLSVVNLDRTTLCGASTTALQAIGSDIQLAATINVRATPGGALIGEAAVGQVYRVLDFAVTDWQSQTRYYKISDGGLEGFIYAGTKDDHANWAVAAPVAAPVANGSTGGIAAIGNSVQIVNDVGINLRGSIGGSVLTVIPKGANVEVATVTVQGSQSSIYYQVTYQGQTGVIYSGELLPTNTVMTWTSVVTK